MNEYLNVIELHQLTGMAQPGKQAEWLDYVLHPNAVLVESPKIHPSVSGGIYALFDADDALLYIGKTLNLNLRINGHFYARKIRFKYYSALDIPTEMIRDIEIAHIYALEPPCNTLYERIENPIHGAMVNGIRKAWGICSQLTMSKNN